jgi:predicted RNA methylase
MTTLALPGMEPEADQALSQFDTPPRLARDLVSLVAVRGAVVLEPSAGRGNVVAALLEAGAEHVYAVELDPARVAVLRERFPRSRVTVVEADFLAMVPGDGRVPRGFSAIVGNPPYNRAKGEQDGEDTKHVRHMLDFAEQDADIALILRTVFLHGGERCRSIWPRVTLRALEPCAERVKFGDQGGMIDVSLFALRTVPQPIAAYSDVVVRWR